jgi:selenocysteine lyase/cysteine desulfurase
LNGPPSTGILYIKNKNIQPPEFYPIMSQRMNRYLPTDDGEINSFPMAEALQIRGCSNTPGFVAMQTAIDFQQSLGGFSKVESRIISLSNIVKKILVEKSSTALISPFKDSRVTTGLTVFFPFSWNNPSKIYQDKATSEKIVAELLKKNIQIRFIGFKDHDKSNKSYALRVSTAIFNSEEQVGLLMTELKRILSTI